MRKTLLFAIMRNNSTITYGGIMKLRNSLLALLAALPLMLSAADWPCFNGPRQDNISPDTGLLKEWPAEGPKLLFKFDKCGKGYSSVSVVGDTLYTAGDFEDDCMVIALDSSGKQKWAAPAGGTWNSSYPGTRATPTIDGDNLYIMNALGEINCLNAKDGTVKWTTNVSFKLKGKKGNWGYAESPIVDGNNLLCMVGSAEKLLVALDKNTGKEVWATKNTLGDSASYCTPVIVNQMSLRTVITMSQKNVVGIDPKTGELLWSFPHPTKYDVNASTPVYYKGYVYVSSGYGTGNDCYLISDYGRSVTKQWANTLMDNHHGGLVGLDGYVYGSAERSFLCLELATGKAAWNAKDIGKGSVTYADGMLYTLSERGKLALVEASPSAEKLVSSFQVPAEGSKDPFWAHPVVINGVLYVRHGGNLFAYSVKK